jgi:hypothetical protein
MATRDQLIGLDKPAAPSLRGLKDPRPELRRQARGHERNRLESVAEALGLIGLLAARKVLSGHELVAIKGAVYQFGSGLRADFTNAAHCLPGHLYFNALPLEGLADWSPVILQQQGIKALAMASKLRNLAARTDVVDQWVNRVDSDVEKMSGERGLKRTFARTVERLIGEMTRRPLTGWKAFHRLLAEHVDYYRMHAAFACQERCDRYRTELTRTTAPSERETLDFQQLIAQEYLELLQDRGFEPEAVSFNGFERMLRDVLVAP